MGCGMCAPKSSQYRAAAVSPTGGKGKTLPADAAVDSVSTEGHFRKAKAKGKAKAREGATVPAPERCERLPTPPSPGPREAAEAAPGEALELPGAALPPELELTALPICQEESPGEQAAPQGAAHADSAAEHRSSPSQREGGSITDATELRKASPAKNSQEWSDDESEEEDLEAAMRAAASVLTPRSGTGAPLEPASQPSEPSRGAGAVTPRSLGVLYGFPDDVDLSTSAQLILLRWARWGRNSWRCKEEEKIKAMQHMKFPRSSRPPPPQVVLSPQPTPTGTPRAEEKSSASSPPKQQPQLTGAARLRAGGAASLGDTITSRDGWVRHSASADLFDGLREEQRDSMDEQGTRVKLTQGLGAAAATAFSTGTPGFGTDTPGFPVSHSGAASGTASMDASVASSGVASPVKGGQLSPWILEAEALVEENEDDDSPCGPAAPAAAWALEPSADSLLLSLEEELLGPSEKEARAAQPPPKVEEYDVDASEAAPALDMDELDQVQMFQESPKKKALEAEKPEEKHSSNSEVQTEEPSKPLDVEPPGYKVGELVSYFSASHNAWMPARVVERKSRSIYLVDKQMRGCLSKVKASDLVSEREEKANPVLRAFTAFTAFEERSVKDQPKAGSGVKSPGSSSTRASTGSQSPAATRPRGKVVRDDFSDDSDDG